MKTLNIGFGMLLAMGFMLVFSSEMYAQIGRGRFDRGRHNGYYYGSRPSVSIGIGYNPYFNYRPVSRPRIYYRPAYRLPYRYNHFGPAFGVRIGVLPFGYSQFFIGNNPYYYNDGIYYRPNKTGGYLVTQPPLGAMVKKLPSGAKVTVIDGQKYYELGGTFYQERMTASNKLRYEVVGTDGVLNTTNADAEDEEEDIVHSPTPPSVNNNKSPVPADGSMISQLPAGCTTLVLNQQKYFVSPSGVYYQEMVDANNTISYKVAGSASTTITQ